MKRERLGSKISSKKAITFLRELTKINNRGENPLNKQIGIYIFLLLNNSSFG